MKWHGLLPLWRHQVPAPFWPISNPRGFRLTASISHPTFGWPCSWPVTKRRTPQARI